MSFFCDWNNHFDTVLWTCGLLLGILFLFAACELLSYSGCFVCFFLYNHVDFFPFLPPPKNLDFRWDSRVKEAFASHSAWKVMWCEVGQCRKKLIIMSRWPFQGALFQVYRSIGDSVQYAIISWICEKWQITLQIHSLILLRFWCMCFMSMWRLCRVGSKFLLVLHLSISSGRVVLEVSSMFVNGFVMESSCSKL